MRTSNSSSIRGICGLVSGPRNYTDFHGCAHRNPLQSVKSVDSFLIHGTTRISTDAHIEILFNLWNLWTCFWSTEPHGFPRMRTSSSSIREICGSIRGICGLVSGPRMHTDFHGCAHRNPLQSVKSVDSFLVHGTTRISTDAHIEILFNP